MIARNVESRILKLEAQRKRPDEILVIWRSPGQEVADVIAGTAFVRGDRVICSEWFGEGEPPLPKWCQACHMRDFDPTEQDRASHCSAPAFSWSLVIETLSGSIESAGPRTDRPPG